MAYFRDMSFEEYRQLAFDGLRERLPAFPKEEVEAYIKTLEEDVRKAYDSDCKPGITTGVICFDPDGWAYGAMMSF